MSYADRVSSDIPLPECWGLFYEEDHPDCRGCVKSASCRAQYDANRVGGRPRIGPVVGSTQPAVSTPLAQRPLQAQQGYAYQYPRIEDKRMDFSPKPGETHAERLGKNIAAAIIQAICQQIYHFFDTFRW